MHTGSVFHIGSVIRALRQQRRMGLIAFAKRIGISPTTLSRIERTGRNFERATLVKIAAGLSVTESDLYALQEEMGGVTRKAVIDGLGGKGGEGEPGVAESEPNSDEGSGQPMPDPDQVHGMITALRFAPPERRDEFVQFCIAQAIGLRRKRATGTDPNG